MDGKNLVSTVSGETGFLNSTPHGLFKILMEVEYLIRPRNGRVVRSVAAEILSVCRRQDERDLLGVVSFSILGEPSVVLKKISTWCTHLFGHLLLRETRIKSVDGPTIETAADLRYWRDSYNHQQAAVSQAFG